MTDYGSLFVNLIEGEVVKSTSPKQTKKHRKFHENVDFDSYFDNLLEDFVTEEQVVEQSVYEEPIIDTSVQEPQELVYEEVVQEDVIQTPTIPAQPVMGMMDDLTDKLGSYLSRTNTKYIEPDPQDFNVVVENLHRQIQDVRRLVLENTVVSGIGQGGDGQGPGSGEVWFRKLDDVDFDGLEPGDGIIWDGNKWRPEKKCYTIDGGDYEPDYEYYLDAHGGSDLTNQNPDGSTDGGDASANPCDDNYEIRQGLGDLNKTIGEIQDLQSKGIRVEH